MKKIIDDPYAFVDEMLDGILRAHPRQLRLVGRGKRVVARAGATLLDGLRQALAAAETGVKATLPLQSKIGRAAWIGERTVGHQDPGATSFYLMFKSAVDHLARRPEDTRAAEENR